MRLFKQNLLYFFSDGGIRPKPPAASSAVVVKDAAGQILEWHSRLLPSLTSCEAEYHGLLDALTLAARLKPAQAIFYLDSQVVVGQVSGQFSVREPRLKTLQAQVARQVAQLQTEHQMKLEFYYLPREYNLLADALASDALLLPPPARKIEKVARIEKIETRSV